jgi:hypothetical protein
VPNHLRRPICVVVRMEIFAVAYICNAAIRPRCTTVGRLSHPDIRAMYPAHTWGICGRGAPGSIVHEPLSLFRIEAEHWICRCIEGRVPIERPGHELASRPARLRSLGTYGCGRCTTQNKKKPRALPSFVFAAFRRFPLLAVDCPPAPMLLCPTSERHDPETMGGMR